MDVEGAIVGTYIFRADAQLDVAGELALECLLVVSLEFLHVFCNMLAEDVLTVNGSVECLLLGVVAWEALDGMRDVEAAVDSAFHGAEHSGSGGGAGESNVQVAAESTRSIVQRLNQVLFAGDVGASTVEAV